MISLSNGASRTRRKHSRMVLRSLYIGTMTERRMAEQGSRPPLGSLVNVSQAAPVGSMRERRTRGMTAAAPPLRVSRAEALPHMLAQDERAGAATLTQGRQTGA